MRALDPDGTADLQSIRIHEDREEHDEEGRPDVVLKRDEPVVAAEIQKSQKRRCYVNCRFASPVIDDQTISVRDDRALPEIVFPRPVFK